MILKTIGLVLFKRRGVIILALFMTGFMTMAHYDGKNQRKMEAEQLKSVPNPLPRFEIGTLEKIEDTTWTVALETGIVRQVPRDKMIRLRLHDRVEIFWAWRKKNDGTWEQAYAGAMRVIPTKVFMSVAIITYIFMGGVLYYTQKHGIGNPETTPPLTIDKSL